MTEYNEGARGRARCWEQRARRAEAECERLRDALRQLSFAAQTTGGTAGRDEGLVAAIGMAETALATPPPAHSDDHE